MGESVCVASLKETDVFYYVKIKLVLSVECRSICNP